MTTNDVFQLDLKLKFAMPKWMELEETTTQTDELLHKELIFHRHTEIWMFLHRSYDWIRQQTPTQPFSILSHTKHVSQFHFCYYLLNHRMDGIHNFFLEYSSIRSHMVHAYGVNEHTANENKTLTSGRNLFSIYLWMSTATSWTTNWN